MKNILHIAAHYGNVGDNASHLGFEEILKQLRLNYKIDKLEIRKAYKNYSGNDALRFDKSFAVLANQYDLVIFGGGGFLDYWVEGSSTGTTIDVPYEILNLIDTKVSISSVGSNPHRKIPEENYEKFKKFLSFLKNSDNFSVALRNDGSVRSLKKDFGEKCLVGISEILDHAYFYEPNENENFLISEKYIALNITEDQLEMSNFITSENKWYFEELEKLITYFSQKGLKTILVPHIIQDISAINSLINSLPNQLARNNIIVAPCIQGNEGANIIFNIYKNAQLVIASRYHANVCALKMQVPTIGLSPLPRVSYTHEKMSKLSSSVALERGFSQNIIALSTKLEELKIDREKLESKKKETLLYYRKLLKI